MLPKDKRFPKQFGDFAESLVMYVLGLKHYSVALIDHVGADVIAVDRGEGTPKRYAVSVKGRNFPANESKSYQFDQDNMTKLRETADFLGMTPAVAFVFVDEQETERKIRLIVSDLDDLEHLADRPEADFINRNHRGGLQIKFTATSRANHLEKIKAEPTISYTELMFTTLETEL